MTKANEQWKLDGNCDWCRRENYCSHECTAHRKRVEKEIKDFIARKTASKILRGFVKEQNDE